MNDEHNSGSPTQMRKLLDMLNDIEGEKIAWTTIVLLTGAYVAYKVTRDW